MDILALIVDVYEIVDVNEYSNDIFFNKKIWNGIVLSLSNTIELVLDILSMQNMFFSISRKDLISWI